jgi:hypothetical protein
MSYRSIGRKIRRSVDVIGQKIKQGQRVGMKVGRQLDVGGRKVGNTARRVSGAIEAVKPFLEGTPLQAGANIASGVLKGVSAGAKEARRAGRALEKVSQRDIVNEAKERLQGEMSNFA